jgi:hypothetical protein
MNCIFEVRMGINMTLNGQGALDALKVELMVKLSKAYILKVEVMVKMY